MTHALLIAVAGDDLISLDAFVWIMRLLSAGLAVLVGRTRFSPWFTWLVGVPISLMAPFLGPLALACWRQKPEVIARRQAEIDRARKRLD